MKFKQFLLEGSKEDIITILSDMSEDDFKAFTDWLFNDFFGEGDEIDVDIESDEPITIEEITEILDDMSSEELDFILMVLSESDDEDEDEEESEDDEMSEAMGRIMKAANRNKKKRKKFTHSKAWLRRTKAKRKQQARMNRAERKKYYRANKVRASAYMKSYRSAVGSGKHFKKIRRASGN